MSATHSLKHTMARSTDAVLHLIQHGLLIIGLVLLFAFFNIVIRNPASAQTTDADAGYALTEQSAPNPSYSVPADPALDAPSGFTLSPRMQGALDYVTRRYRVSPDALMPVFEVAQIVGQERRIDPLLIVAIIAIESRFNPFAESPMGAQGLMQVIPRFHMDKIPEDAGERPFLDPETNIRIGATVLAEAIRLRGSLTGGLQFYAGSSDPAGGYANRVLAEKARLEQAAQRGAAPSA